MDSKTRPFFQIRSVSAGFSLIEVLIALAVMVAAAFGLMTLVGNQQKSLKNEEQKLSVQAFVQTMKLNMAEPEECKVVLDLANAPIVIPKSELPGQQNAIATTYKKQLAKVILPGVKTIDLGVEHEGIILKSANLIFNQPMTVGGLKYLVDLQVILAKKNTTSSLGASEFKRNIPFHATFASQDATNLVMTECYSGGVSDSPEVLCEKMGGRWLSSTNNANYASLKVSCPLTNLEKERCVMDSAFTLARDELADNVPCQGGTNSAGERAEECYYQSTGSAIVKTSLCPSYEGTRNGNRCHFDVNSKRWGMWYYKNGVPVTLRYRCDRGVKISTKASSTEQLAWNERLYLINSSSAPPDDEPAIEFSASEQQSLQETVEKCYFEPDSDKYQACNNISISDSGYLGKAGSCIYVKGIRLLNQNNVTTSRINRCLAESSNAGDCPSGLDNYTGWIRVHSDYPRKISENTLLGNILTEARGYPCFRVELNSSMGRFPTPPATEVLTPMGSIPTLDLKNNPGRVRQCRFVATAAPNRKALLPCENEAIGMTGDTNDFVGYNATGTNNDVESKLEKNTCWYFKNTPLKNVGTYTGWVRLKADLPDWGHYNLLPDNSLSRKSTSTHVVQGDPCDMVYADPE